MKAEELRAQQAGAGDGQRCAHDRSREARAQARAQHHPLDVETLRAEGHADADLGGPPADADGQGAEEAGGRLRGMAREAGTPTARCRPQAPHTRFPSRCLTVKPST
jgi:hypothetical protein